MCDFCNNILFFWCYSYKLLSMLEVYLFYGILLSFTAPSDHDLMSAMMSKITALETRVVSQGKEISEKVG